MTELVATADLYDQYEEQLQSSDLQFQQFGGRRHFAGEIVTLKVFQDNALVKQTLAEDGTGKVLVIDAEGSLHTALVGDLIAASAVQHGWAGIVINGPVRDSAVLATLEIGIKALGTQPRKSGKTGAGEQNVPVTFGGVTYTPGKQLVADDDGVVVLP